MGKEICTNGGGMRSWRSDEILTSPTETKVGTRFDLSNPHKPSHALYHVLAFRVLFQIINYLTNKIMAYEIHLLEETTKQMIHHFDSVFANFHFTGN